MLASRAVKPKLSLNIATATSQTSRPTLSLKSPMSMTSMRSPISPAPVSPSPISPTVRNTRLNQRGYSTVQQPTYAYTNPSTSRSILKKSSRSSPSSSSTRRQLSFSETPIVYCVTPIEEEDYYGTHNKKMSKDERRWARRWEEIPCQVIYGLTFSARIVELYWRHYDMMTTQGWTPAYDLCNWYEQSGCRASISFTGFFEAGQSRVYIEERFSTGMGKNCTVTLP